MIQHKSASNILGEITGERDVSCKKYTGDKDARRVRRVNTNVDHEVKRRYWRWLQSKEENTL